MDEYLAWMDEHRRSAKGARWAAAAFILPKLGSLECAKLSAPIIRKWHTGIAAAPPRLRSKQQSKGARFRDVDLSDPEMKRRRRSSANGILTILKAALNRAWRAGSIANDDAWRRVRPFPSPTRLPRASGTSQRRNASD